MEFSQELKDSIKNNMLHITTVMKKKPRNYLNKQLQDAVCNYFLENYAAPFLKEEYEMASGRELRKKIEKSLPNQGKKYINLLNKFKSEIQRVNKGDVYRAMLSSIVCEEEKYDFATEEWCTLQRKKILALLLIIHWDEENILNFYDMWNSLYPTDPLIKQKLSKEEKEKMKKSKKNNSNMINHTNNANTTIINTNNNQNLAMRNIENNASNSDLLEQCQTLNRLSYSSSCSEQLSNESPCSSLNSKRSSSTFINSSLLSNQNNTFQEQAQQQQPYAQPALQKKVINNRIFEENEQEQEEQQNFKFDQPMNQMRVCQTVEIAQNYSYQQQQQHYQSNYLFNQQQQQQQYQQQQFNNYSQYFYQPCVAVFNYEQSQNFFPQQYQQQQQQQFQCYEQQQQQFIQCSANQQYLQQELLEDVSSDQSIESNENNKDYSSSTSSSCDYVYEKIQNNDQHKYWSEESFSSKIEDVSLQCHQDQISQEQQQQGEEEICNFSMIPPHQFSSVYCNDNAIEQTLFSFLNY